MANGQQDGLPREEIDAVGSPSGAADGPAEGRVPGSAAPDDGPVVPLVAGQRATGRERKTGRLNTHQRYSHAGKRAHTTTKRGRRGEPDSSIWFRLVDRDRRILALLSEHQVLTTEQIAAIEFTSVRRAQDRLAALRALGVLFSFRESYRTGGTSQARFALGYLGARFIAAQRAEKPPTQQAHQRFLERLAWWPKLNHQLGVNGFFCDLAAVARRDRDTTRDTKRDCPPGVSDVGTRLGQWWSEQRCTKVFRDTGGIRTLRPDGYGCWVERGRWVRFFLEYDTGTETLSTVTKKLDSYGRLPTDQLGILVFSVHSSRREIALRQALHRAVRDGGRNVPAEIVIATSARDLEDPDGPAGPVWALFDHSRYRDVVTRRSRLSELPQRGPDVELHAGFVGQPYSELAFPDNDNDVWHLIHDYRPPQPGWEPLHSTPTRLGGAFDDDQVIVTGDEDDDPYAEVEIA